MLAITMALVFVLDKLSVDSFLLVIPPNPLQGGYSMASSEKIPHSIKSKVLFMKCQVQEIFVVFVLS